MKLLQRTMGKDFGKFFYTDKEKYGTPEEQARAEVETYKNIDYSRI